MASKDDLMIPKSFLIRWLQESDTTEDFRRRLDHYVEITRNSNWNVGEGDR